MKLIQLIICVSGFLFIAGCSNQYNSPRCCSVQPPVATKASPRPISHKPVPPRAHKLHLYTK